MKTTFLYLSWKFYMNDFSWISSNIFTLNTQQHNWKRCVYFHHQPAFTNSIKMILTVWKMHTKFLHLCYVIYRILKHPWDAFKENIKLLTTTNSPPDCQIIRKALKETLNCHKKHFVRHVNRKLASKFSSNASKKFCFVFTNYCGARSVFVLNDIGTIKRLQQK